MFAAAAITNGPTTLSALREGETHDSIALDVGLDERDNSPSAPHVSSGSG